MIKKISIRTQRNRLIILAAILVFLTGCVKAQFTEPITSFRDSIDKSGTAITAYYSGLNQFERELYLESCLYDPTVEVGIRDEKGNLTPLSGDTFSAKSIKARKDSINLLGVYAQRLGELAGSDAPRKFSEGTRILGDNLSNLNATFAQLAIDTTGSTKKDNTAINYIGPVSTIIAVVGKMYLENKQSDALEDAIIYGAPAVRNVLLLLQKDLTDIIILLQRTGLKEKLTNLVTYYNSNRKNLSIEERKKILHDIEIAAINYDSFIVNNPNNLIQSMSNAHEALVKYAESPKSPQNFAELLAALETFKNNANEAVGALIQIRDLKKG